MTDRERSSGSLVSFAKMLADDGTFDRAERMEVLRKMLPDQDRAAIWRFGMLLTLSVLIAVMGLVANSAAVVIGAMLIAPLMTPIVSFAGAVGLGLGKRASRAGLMVVGGSLWSVILAALVTRVVPDTGLGSEILSRTSPDVKDLVVAVCAGAAGAYGVAREEVSAALPGVAVAVALVPPLATTGILIERGERVLAEGSALLFVTNLFAIALAALITLVATRVIPTVRFFVQNSRIGATAVAIVAATAIVAVPLTSRSLDAASSSRELNTVRVEVDAWLGPIDLDVTGLTIEGSRVIVELTGLDEPPSAYDLATRLVPVLGAGAEVVVRWDSRAQGTATADRPPVEDPTPAAVAVLEGFIERLAADGIALELLDVSVRDGRVDVVVSGPDAPPPAPTLPQELAEAIGGEVTLALRWIQTVDPNGTVETPDQIVARLVNAWVGPRTSVRVVATAVTGTSETGRFVLVDLGAQGNPVGLVSLERVLAQALGGTVSVTVRVLPLEVTAPSDDVMAVPILD
jgi:uncharacterized hydrophobic protein (TIGR00271 family)